MRLLFLSLLLALSAAAQETLIRESIDPKTDTHVEVEALFSNLSPGGYLPVRVTIANNMKGKRTIRLKFDSDTGYRNLQTHSQFSFTAEENKVLTQDILVPVSPPNSNFGSEFRLSSILSGDFGDAYNSLEFDVAPPQAAVLMSSALYTPNGSKLDNQASILYSGSRSYGGSSQFAARFDPKKLPDKWLAYASWDTMMMLASDWTDASAGARNAILSWVRLGGKLVIYSTTAATPTSLDLPVETPGMGEILFEVIDSILLDEGETANLAQPPGISVTQHQSISIDYNSKWPLQKNFGAKPFHYVVFIVVLLAFGIIVGPINLFVFAKSGKRHLLFVTTPIISLSASLLMIGLIIFQDGFGGSGVRMVLMEVRSGDGENAAYIRQEQIARTGVLLKSGFSMDTPSYFAPVPIKDSRWARYTAQNGGVFDIQPEGNQFHYHGDWYQSRSEHGHFLSTVVPTRGRIESTSSPDLMVSTFDFPIQTLYYFTPDGTWMRAEKIATGKKFKLTPVNFSMVDPQIKEIAQQFSNKHREIFGRLAMRRGHYFALTDAAPGVATNPSIRWIKTTTVLTGPIATP